MPERELPSDYERLRKLQAVGEAALASLDLDDLLDELLRRVREVFAADTCAVLLLEGDVLVPRAAKGIEEEVGVGIAIPFGRGFAGRIAAERRTMVLDDVGASEVVLNPVLRAKGLTTIVGVPLLGHRGVLGVLHVGRLTANPFSREDVEHLELVADQVARALERALVHDELVRLDRLKREFIATAAHELRTPVTSVSGLASTLYHRGDGLDDVQRTMVVSALYEQSERLATLTTQLLDLSRLDAAVVPIRPERLRIHDRIQQIVATAAPGRSQFVTVDVPVDLEVVADPEALDHIATNLIVNALRYGEPPVLISAAQRDRHFRLAVEDRGAGVDPAFVPKLFERFTRSAASVASHASGAGLGLSIARSYAQAHGGELLYEDAQPHGARFALVLPRVPDEPAA